MRVRQILFVVMFFLLAAGYGQAKDTVLGKSWIAHGPGSSGDGAYTQGLLVHSELGNDWVFIQTNFLKAADAKHFLFSKGHALKNPRISQDYKFFKADGVKMKLVFIQFNPKPAK